MSTNSVQGRIEAAVCVRQRVSISRWVNEPYPAWDQILTAHDVARLIRRPPWVFSSMAAVGQFPQRQRFRGKKVGWLKADVLEWMARTHPSRIARSSDKTIRRHKPVPSSQQSLPLEHLRAPALDPHTAQSCIAGVSP
jgi:predicted DNA-binding transcriptional regulator AlpA